AAVEVLLTTGGLPLYDGRRARCPPGLRDCVRIPGVGPARAKLLHQALGIDSLEALEKACLEGRLTTVKGFGPKSAEKILRGIAARRAGAGSYHRHRAL